MMLTANALIVSPPAIKDFKLLSSHRLLMALHCTGFVGAREPGGQKDLSWKDGRADPDHGLWEDLS